MAWTTLQDHAELRLEHVTLTGTVEHDSLRNALAVTCPDTGKSEALTVDLTSDGYVVLPGETSLDLLQQPAISTVVAR